jgi:hypothetical protein
MNLKEDLNKCQTELHHLPGGDIEKSRTIDSLQNRCDSLYDELFRAKVQGGRYELTFEHLKDVNPKLGEEMQEWMNHETE